MLVALLRPRLGNARYGFLYGPGMIALAFVVAGLLLPYVDRWGGAGGVGGFGGDASAARTVLSIIAGSLITVAGLTFSITILSLQLVSQQFSPRAMRGLLGDRTNQVVAGCFVGIFAYCLLVLRTVRDEATGEPGFVPSLSVTVAIVLAVLTVGLLLTFIHHMSQTLQVSTIAAGIGRSTLAAIEQLYPTRYAGPAGDSGQELVRTWGRERSALLRPTRPGYVQSIAVDELVRLTGDAARIEVRVVPGDFVTEQTVIAGIWGEEVGDVGGAADVAVVVANERNLDEDAEYGVRQLSDIAVKALSPGVNDPTTALTCVGYLRAIMESLAVRAFPDEVCSLPDEGSTVVVLSRPFDEFVDASFVEIGRYASRDARVAVGLLDALASVTAAASGAGADERVETLRAAARVIGEQAVADAPVDRDRELVRHGLAEVERQTG